MKKNVFILIISSIAILGMSYLIIIPMVKQTTKENALKAKQEILAKSLGVKIEDYPGTFPTNYFAVVVKPKMTLNEVHNIVRGYVSVYHCFGTDELYYYLSEDPNEAIRFMLYYDEQGYFVRFEGEDPNSRTLGLSSECSNGLLKR